MNARLFAVVVSLGGACSSPAGSVPEVKPEAKAEVTPKAEAKAVEAEAQVDDGELRARAAGEGLIGRAGPAFVLKTIDGVAIDLGALVGKKPVYLKFWATWCVPCRAQMPGFEEIFKGMGDKLEVIAVNTGFSDNEADVRAFQKELGIHMPIVVDDGRLAEVFNLRVTPQHVVIGRDGRISHVGHLEDERLRAALRAAVEGGDAPAVAAAPVRAEAAALKVGDAVGGLSLKMMSGEAVALGAGGRASGLFFFAPWCEPYLAESRPAVSAACKRMREQVEVLAAKGDVRWLGVSSGLWTAEKDVADYVSTTGTKLPLAIDADGGVFRAFGVREVPAVVLVDAQGRVARVLGGGAAEIEAPGGAAQ